MRDEEPVNDHIDSNTASLSSRLTIIVIFWMRVRTVLLKSLIALAWGITGCATVAGPVAPPAPRSCRDAGFTNAEIARLTTDFEVTRDAGATADEVLSDVATACEACVDPAAACDQMLCEECFQQVVQEVFP